MHDDRCLAEQRLDRVMAERIRPAVYAASVPLDLAAWLVPGEPVPVTDALAASYAVVRPGFAVTRADVVDLLERPLSDVPRRTSAPLLNHGGAIPVTLRSFQILTLRLVRKP